jgi:hypothetical protein
MVIALAPAIHRLAGTQGLTCHEIADALATSSEKTLLVEIVSPNDPEASEWRPLEGFVDALGEQFESIERISLQPSKRALLLCTDRNQPPGHLDDSCCATARVDSWIGHRAQPLPL